MLLIIDVKDANAPESKDNHFTMNENQQIPTADKLDPGIVWCFC